jgi:hypothetical protein
MKTLFLPLIFVAFAQAPQVSQGHEAAWLKAKRALAKAEKAIVEDCIAGYRPQFDPTSLTFACVLPATPSAPVAAPPKPDSK